MTYNIDDIIKALKNCSLGTKALNDAAVLIKEQNQRIEVLKALNLQMHDTILDLQSELKALKPEDTGEKKIKIKPCPFCNASETVQCLPESIISGNADEDTPDYFAVNCNFNLGGCGATGGYRETEEEAIKAWNNRVNED